MTQEKVISDFTCTTTIHKTLPGYAVVGFVQNILDSRAFLIILRTRLDPRGWRPECNHYQHLVLCLWFLRYPWLVRFLHWGWAKFSLRNNVISQKICGANQLVNFKDFSRPNKEIKYFLRTLTEFKDFSRRRLKFKTFSRLYEPCGIQTKKTVLDFPTQGEHVLTLYAPVSTYKFSKLISIHFLKK